MPDPTLDSYMVRFGAFEVNLRSAELRKQGLKVKIQEQPFQVLAMLLERPGQTVTREELHNKLWPADTFVDFEHGLNAAINKLREALGDSADNPRFVETLPRRGYRFIAPVETMGAQGGAPAVAPVSSPAMPVAAMSPSPAETVVRHRRYSRHWEVLVPAALIAGAVLTYWLMRPAAPPPELKERRLTGNPSENSVNLGAISPDGKYLAYSDQMGLHLKLIQTGQILDIPQPAGRAPDLDNWWVNGWFPDSTKFHATGIEAEDFHTGWVVSVIGGPPRKLRDGAAVYSVSPDGNLIAFGTGQGFLRSREIWLMGAQGEDPRKFVSGSEDDAFWWAAWSPDGQRIAYTRFHRSPDGLEGFIESRDLKGGPPTLILSYPRLRGEDMKFLWLPGGRFVYSMLEPEEVRGGSNLWEMQVDTKTGEPVSKPRRITNWAENWVIGINATADGKQLAVTEHVTQSHVEIGELEAGGRRLRNPRRLTLEESSDFPRQWMPDGKAVLFQSNRNGTWGIYKQGLDETTAQPVVTGPDYKDWPVVSPDGAWILYLSKASAGANPTSPVRIMQVPTSGGAPQLVLEGRGVGRLACTRSPASLCVFSEPSPDLKQLIFSAFDPAQAPRRRELTRVNLLPSSHNYSWDLSADGSRLAFTQYDDREARIQILPLADREVREVNVTGRHDLTDLYWAADGRGLFVSAGEGIGAALLYMDLEGHSQVIWRQRVPSFTYPAMGIPSPDGRYLAVLGVTTDGNMWLLENF